MEGIINGKKYDFTEYWKKRLEQIIEDGVKLEDLQNLSTDLSMENLTGNEKAIQVPCVLISVPLYDVDDDNNVIPFTIDEVEEALDFMEAKDDFCGYTIDKVIESVTYIG